MIIIKKKTKLFFKSFYLSLTIFICLFIGIYGSFKAYESIRLIGFGEYRSAVEYRDGKLKIFDLEINVLKILDN